MFFRKESGKGQHILVTHRNGDVRYGQVGFLKQFLRLKQTALRQVLFWRAVKVFLKDAVEIGLRNPKLLAQNIDCNGQMQAGLDKIHTIVHIELFVGFGLVWRGIYAVIKNLQE